MRKYPGSPEEIALNSTYGREPDHASREMIRRALLFYAEDLRRQARSRPNAGPVHVQYRAHLRQEAHFCERLAARYETPEGNES